MPKYRIEITETLQREIVVEAKEIIEAQFNVKDMYDNGEIVLNEDDLVNLNISYIESVAELESSKENEDEFEMSL